MEEFRDVIGYEGHYKISNLGNVKSLERLSLIGRQLKEKILKNVVDGKGYLRVSLSLEGESKTRKIHQLVAESFLNHKPCGYKLVVNHIDFDKSNNNVNNLEIVSQRENANLKHIKSVSNYVGVAWHKNANKWVAQIVINGKQVYLGLYDTEKVAGVMYYSALTMHNNGKDVEKIKSFIRYKD